MPCACIRRAISLAPSGFTARSCGRTRGTRKRSICSASSTLSAGNSLEAERLIGQSLQLNPHSPDGWYNRGCALQGLQRHGEAVSCFDHAVALKPDYDEAWTNRGVALLALRRHAEALEILQQGAGVEAAMTSKR